jgi:hypothetical protein
VLCCAQIREMLDSCRLEAVKRSLGRPYRLVAEVNLLDWQQQQLQGYSTVIAAATSSSGSSNGRSPGSSAAPLLHPGSVFVPNHSLLNQQPAAGVFLCDLQLFVGATAHADLLQLQRGVAAASSSSSSSSKSDGGIEILPISDSSSSSSTKGCIWCIKAAQQQLEVTPDGVLLPQAVWEAAESCWNNAAAAGSRDSMISSSTGSSSSSSSSLADDVMSSSSSSSSGRLSTDPLVWDTDDRDDEDEDRPCDAALRPFSALLTLDIDSCVMQFCTIP